ncbi:hypothetical protein STANM309S_05953 [Streptomyces tanashiensis]
MTVCPVARTRVAPVAVSSRTAAESSLARTRQPTGSRGSRTLPSGPRPIRTAPESGTVPRACMGARTEGGLPSNDTGRSPARAAVPLYSGAQNQTWEPAGQRGR